MIYISHLLDDSEMADVIEKTGAGMRRLSFLFRKILTAYNRISGVTGKDCVQWAVSI